MVVLAFFCIHDDEDSQSMHNIYNDNNTFSIVLHTTYPSGDHATLEHATTFYDFSSIIEECLLKIRLRRAREIHLFFTAVVHLFSPTSLSKYALLQ